MFVPHSALESISRSDIVVEPPVMEPHDGERSTAVWITPPEQVRKAGQGACSQQEGKKRQRCLMQAGSVASSSAPATSADSQSRSWELCKSLERP